jgi:hypothetical protein
MGKKWEEAATYEKSGELIFSLLFRPTFLRCQVDWTKRDEVSQRIVDFPFFALSAKIADLLIRQRVQSVERTMPFT